MSEKLMICDHARLCGSASGCPAHLPHTTEEGCNHRSIRCDAFDVEVECIPVEDAVQGPEPPLKEVIPPDYEKAYHILMEHFHRIPDFDKPEVSRKLKEAGL